WALPGVQVRLDGSSAADGAQELVLGGRAIADGYGTWLGHVSQPEHDRFSTIRNGRWYRTGDVVRPQEDGSFEYVGRADRQIKIQGVRIELSAIEASASRVPDIVNA